MQADDNVYAVNVNGTALSDANTGTWNSNPTRITDVRYVSVSIVWWDDPKSRDFHHMSINKNHTNRQREVLGSTVPRGRAGTQ
jgi:hypothetical protein